MENKIKVIGKNGQKIEITEAEKEKRENIKKVNDEFKKINAEKSKIINEQEIWKYFFENFFRIFIFYFCLCQYFFQFFIFMYSFL